MLETLPGELWPVSYGITHVAAVDEVELGIVGPRGFNVVDFEMDIWRDPLRLDRGEIIADNLQQEECGR